MANLKAKIQKTGSFLSAMVMPNIGAFIAWGVLAALFIDTGWIPNAYLNKLVAPTLTYLMPLLIAYTGGYNIYGKRGGVAGALATMGVIIGADITMLAGGMLMGPIGAIIIKKVDKLFEGKIKPGMEMLIDNFSMGIVGALMMVVGYVIVEPIFSVILAVLSGGVQFLVNANLLPFTSIFVQPAQVLFLNNAINHGIMIPIGIEQAADFGKSILFLVEANGGTWVGLLLAFCVWGKGMAKKSAPGATAIMFFGGIGEVAFPYALIRPATILGPICGNIVSLFILQIFNGGTVAAVSPGSFLALLAMTPRGSFFANILAYFAALVISFLVAGFFLMRDKSDNLEDEAIETTAADASVIALKAAEDNKVIGTRKVEKIIFACDAGMGSSVMGSSVLKTQLNKVGVDVTVKHASLNDISADADIVVTSVNLYERAKQSVPADVPILPVNNLVDGNELKGIALKIKEIKESTGDFPTKSEEENVSASSSVEEKTGASEKNIENGVLLKKNIRLNLPSVSKEEAIKAIGQVLVDTGYVTPKYVDAMIAKEDVFNTAIGNNLAIPHGIESAANEIKTSGLAISTYPDGIDWGEGKTAKLVIAVASTGDEHIKTLSKIAMACESEEAVDKILKMTEDEIYELFA